VKLVSVLQSPLKIILPRKTKTDRSFILNLNTYRNTHFQILNQAKSLYKELMQAQIDALPCMSKIAVRFVMYPGSKRLTDTPNVCAIHDKFFMDALVESSKLPEDTYEHYVETGYKFGAIDKCNPRVDIEIYELT